MKKNSTKAFLFLSAMIVLTACGVLLLGREIVFGEGEVIPWLWLAGFAILFVNVVYLFLISLFSLFVKKNHLPEVSLKAIPRTALCYFLRHEDTALLYERMCWSFENNRLPNVDFWMLSDSDSSHEADEIRLYERLRAKYGDCIHYRRRKVPVERKQGNMREFIDSHQGYDFLYICDADSLVPEGTLLKLLSKAMHPANKMVASFQTLIRTANAKTYYAQFEGIASETSQKLYFKTLQAVFGQTISFGHQCLVRRSVFQKINLPKGLLSHDNWDTALLDRMGYRVAFVSDVTTFDEAPANYLEARRREARWSQGTLQGWPLVFMKELSHGVRFLSFYGLYCYLTQPVFLIWGIIGLLAQSYFAGELFSLKPDAVWFNGFVNRTAFLMLIFSLCVIFFHKLVIVRSWKDFKRFIYELFFSTLIYSGNFLYATFDLISIPLKALVWHPMRKDPFERLTFKDTAKTFMPGTILGIWGLWYLFAGTPFPRLSALPILASLSCAIPVVYLSSKSIQERRLCYGRV